MFRAYVNNIARDEFSTWEEARDFLSLFCSTTFKNANWNLSDLLLALACGRSYWINNTSVCIREVTIPARKDNTNA